MTNLLNEFRSTSITWDKATRRIYSPITANASDSNGRKLNIQVVNSGQVENLTGATLHLYWETKDKAHYGLDAFDASDISKGEFEIFYTTGMLSNVGELDATLVLVDSTGKVVSDWFKITVARGIDDDAIQSENSFTSLTQALIDISNLEENYAPRLNDLTTQVQQIATLSDMYDNLQDALNQGGLIILEKNKLYEVNQTYEVIAGTTLDLNGAALVFNLAQQVPAFWVKGSNVTIKNGSIFVYGVQMGGSGHALNCISAGHQSTGEGYDNLTFKDLTLSTNRDDAGATIGIFGECTNVLIENIYAPDNDQCRNIIGLEWGGTPELGTGHPHNVTVRNIKVGKLTYPTFGNGGYGYGVWMSSCFNVTVENIVIEKAYGIAMVTRGDHGSAYAPLAYRDLIGTGIKVSNATIKSFYGYALRAIGSHLSTNFITRSEFPVKFENIKAIGEKVGTNSNIGFQTEQTKGVVLHKFELQGEYTAGITTGINTEKFSVDKAIIKYSDTYAMSIGNNAIATIIRDCELTKNNRLQGGAVTTAAIVLGACKDVIVDNCTFGDADGSETQKYSIAVTSAAVNPNLNDNHTNALSTGGAAYVIGAQANTEINAQGGNNTASDGLTLHGGAPIFTKTPIGSRVFYAAGIPTVGTFKQDDTVYLKNRVSNGAIGAVCVSPGSPGTWRSFGIINT